MNISFQERVKSMEESVLFPANARPSQPSIVAIPVSGCAEFYPQMATVAMAAEAPVEVGVSLALEAVEIPLVSGQVQPTAEVTEAQLEVDASPALKSELCQYGAGLDAELEPNVQKVEVVGMQGLEVGDVSALTLPEADMNISFQERVKSMEESVLFPANARPTQPSIMAIP